MDANIFLDKCREHGFHLFTGTPCSYLKPFINQVIDDPSLEFVGTTNEGDAVALATGAWLGGRRSVVMFQNSGLGNAVNPLTSLSQIVKAPFLGIVTLRGEPGGPKDEPQHKLMGSITTDLLSLMEIPWSYFPQESSEVTKAFSHAEKMMEENKTPFFFVMKKGSVDSYELQSSLKEYITKEYNARVNKKRTGKIEFTRTQALTTIKETLGDKSVYIATTGKTGRELFTLGDTENQLYMVGSMGCALPLGLGITTTEYKNPVCVIDGDGAILMRMGNMALAGQMKPKNLLHIVLDNGIHDSTGGQRTFSETIDFCEVALHCGYDSSWELDSLDALESTLRTVIQKNNESGLHFIRFFIRPGSPAQLARPTVQPLDVAMRLKKYINLG